MEQHCPVCEISLEDWSSFQEHIKQVDHLRSLEEKNLLASEHIDMLLILDQFQLGGKASSNSNKRSWSEAFSQPNENDDNHQNQSGIDDDQIDAENGMNGSPNGPSDTSAETTVVVVKQEAPESSSIPVDVPLPLEPSLKFVDSQLTSGVYSVGSTSTLTQSSQLTCADPSQTFDHSVIDCLSCHKQSHCFDDFKKHIMAKHKESTTSSKVDFKCLKCNVQGDEKLVLEHLIIDHFHIPQTRWPRWDREKKFLCMFECIPCRNRLFNIHRCREHFSCKRHLRELAKHGKLEYLIRCIICDQNMKLDDWNGHFRDKRHKSSSDVIKHYCQRFLEP